MAPAYEAAQLAVFHRLVEKGFVHRGAKPVHWSPASRTALAEAELDYESNHVSPSIHVRFPVVAAAPAPAADADADVDVDDVDAAALVEFLRTQSDTAGGDGGGAPRVSVLIWTTTPWTLPANKAICYHPTIEYCVVQSTSIDAAVDDNDDKSGGGGGATEFLLLATARLPALQLLLPNRHLNTVLTFSGESLGNANLQCMHPFRRQAAPLLPATHVTTDAGTGLVHTAPGHGMGTYA
jgi:isoleucyl-tRNA synthetase